MQVYFYLGHIKHDGKKKKNENKVCKDYCHRFKWKPPKLILLYPGTSCACTIFGASSLTPIDTIAGYCSSIHIIYQVNNAKDNEQPAKTT